MVVVTRCRPIHTRKAPQHFSESTLLPVTLKTSNYTAKAFVEFLGHFKTSSGNSITFTSHASTSHCFQLTGHFPSGRNSFLRMIFFLSSQDQLRSRGAHALLTNGSLAVSCSSKNHKVTRGDACKFIARARVSAPVRVHSVLVVPKLCRWLTLPFAFWNEGDLVAAVKRGWTLNGWGWQGRSLCVGAGL